MFRQFAPYLFVGLFLLACGNSDKIADPEDLSSSSLEKSEKSSSSNKDKKVSSSSKAKDSEKSSSSKKSSSSQSTYDAEKKTLTDLRDGQKYRTTKIGTQVWMAENLNYKTKGSYCLHDKADNCSKYGRLYTWGDAMDSAGTFSKNGKGCGYTKTCSPTYPTRGVCPEGWHIPTDGEFRTLFEYRQSNYENNSAAARLRSKTEWENKFSTDEYGFSALPAGIRHVKTYIEGTTSFWTSQEYQEDDNSRNYLAYHTLFNVKAAYTKFAYGKLSALSVRCIKDEPDSGSPSPPSNSGTSTSKPLNVSKGTLTDSRDGQKYNTVKIGEQTWMAENLKYKTDKSYCPNNNADSCSKYGLLYSWVDALSSACPEGWRLPTSAEFDELINTVGTEKTAGILLKSTSGWSDKEQEKNRDENGCPKRYYYDPDDHYDPYQICINEYVQSWNGIDAFNFSVLPAGADSVFGSRANFLTSTLHSNSYTTSITKVFLYNSNEVTQNSNSAFASVRCLKDISTVPEKGKGTMTDSRDGQKYSTIKIGENTWMAENLNYETEYSYCYNDSAVYCKKYGRLYTWDAAKEACPSGWHLPTESEFNDLMSSVDQSKSAIELKATTDWFNDGENGNPTNKSGFSALPSGYKNYNSFSEMGIFTVFWGSTEQGRKKAVSLTFYHNEIKAFVGFRLKEVESGYGYGYSVRCVKD